MEAAGAVTAPGIQTQVVATRRLAVEGLGQEDCRGLLLLAAMVVLVVALAASALEGAGATTQAQEAPETDPEQVAAEDRLPLLAARDIKGELSYHGIIEYEY